MTQVVLYVAFFCALTTIHTSAQIPAETVVLTNDPLIKAIPQSITKTKFVTSAPEYDTDDDEERPPDPIKEDPLFDPYDEKEDRERGRDPSLVDPNDPDAGNDNQKYLSRHNVDIFDFDPSEGLTFHVFPGKSECFYQDAKYEGDEITGAYIVSSADAHIDLEIKNPLGQVVYRRLGDTEGQYYARPTDAGVFEICFINSDSDGKLVTHVTKLLKSQHPVEREHVSVLAKYASHLDVRLGELESEQRLHHIRTNRFIKIEQSTNERVSFYGTLECFVYVFIGIFQVYYIKSLLDSPRELLKKWVT